MDESKCGNLFSALVSKKVNDFERIEELKLEIPDLPDDVNLYEWKIPKVKNLNSFKTVDSPDFNQTLKQITISKMVSFINENDEGFCSKKCSPVTRDQTEKINKVWENIANLSESDYIDWDLRNEYVLYLNEFYLFFYMIFRDCLNNPEHLMNITKLKLHDGCLK